jgi:DnaK suppressor protein
MDTFKSEAAVRFREDLLRRAAQLREALRHDTQAGRAGGLHEVGDFKDAAADECIASVDDAQAAHAAAELAQVHDALRRIAEGHYGECLDCGDPIDPRRLAALPATAYCASCQAVHEQVAGERH